MADADFRIEDDPLRERVVSSAAFHGAPTLFAAESFPVIGTPISTDPDLIDELAGITMAAALPNQDPGSLDRAHHG